MKNFMGFDGFTWFQGVVEDHNDPEQIGRVRVRCLGIHTEDKEALPTDDLPWAMVMMPTTGASVSQLGHSPSGLLKGSWVLGFFRDGNNCQEPVVMGTFHGYPMERPNTDLGFCDPTGTHPVEIEEPDTSRLARSDKKSKLYIKKNDILKAHPAHPIANSGSTWNVKSNPYNARYPYNKVQQTESGHVIEIDDTPNAERINIQHMSGSFIEMHPNGDIRMRTQDSEVLVEGGENVHVKGDVNLVIDSNCSTYIKGDWNIQVDGNVVEKIKGNQTTTVTGNIDIDGARIDLN
tara:strand:- start:571 stop:1443 length:873 start_codon:yes stop_codon:yes gene_type:complete